MCALLDNRNRNINSGKSLLAATVRISPAFMLNEMLTLQYGRTGLINFGHVGFFAIGAYTSALLALQGVPTAENLMFLSRV